MNKKSIVKKAIPTVIRKTTTFYNENKAERIMRECEENLYNMRKYRKVN